MTIEHKEQKLPQESFPTEATSPPPLVIDDERKAFAELIAFINTHKDPETEVVTIDPDQFIDGIE